MNFLPINHGDIKHGFTTHRVPLEKMVGVMDPERPPQSGDLVLGEVLSVGQHTRIEHRDGTQMHIFPGDWILGAFGNRYATDQFEAYVPKELLPECHLISIGGVCGIVSSKHPSMDLPTRLRVIGGVCDSQGQWLNLRSFGLAPRVGTRGVVLVVGSSMNAGKTTTVGTVVRALKRAGYRVAATKITGTAAGKDARYFRSCGAGPVLDFTHAGFPSTYMASLSDLMDVHRTLVGHLRESSPDYIVVEVADGLYQRETRMLLEHEEFRGGVDHVFFAAGDSMSAECGTRFLKQFELPVRAISGLFTQSPLAMREAEAATGIRCLNIEQMIMGGVLEVMQLAGGKATTSARSIPQEVHHSENGNGTVPARLAAQAAVL